MIARSRNFVLMLPRTHTILQMRTGRQLPSNITAKPFLSCDIQFRIEQRFQYTSQPQKKSGFFGKFVDNIKQEIAKNKEMKENLKKFREEAEKLEHSEALKKARQKYQTVESEASKSSEVLKERIGSLKDKVQDVLEEASKSEFVKKAGQIKEELSKTARGAADSISESSSKIGKKGAFQTITKTAQKVKEEIDQSTYGDDIYRAPKKLRKRVDTPVKPVDIKPNEEATGMELHKDSKFAQSWQNFKDNNPYMNKVLDWKIRYDESDNTMVRASRFVTDKVSDIMGGLFQKTELSEVLTEICKLDPSFDKDDFLQMCREDIIPNILEAIIRGDLETLKDWCYEAPFNVISTPLKTFIQSGYKFDSKILDIDNVDLIIGKMMEQGPVLLISFHAQQIECYRDKSGNVVQGDPEKILGVNYTWALCRDTTELNPKAAWKLLEMAAHKTERLL